MYLFRPALAGILGAAIACGTGVLAAAQAAEAPALTVTGTVSCDAISSNWVIQWSVRSNQDKPGALYYADTSPRIGTSQAGTLEGMGGGTGIPARQDGALVGTLRLPDFGFTTAQLNVTAQYGVPQTFVYATGNVALTGRCGPSIMPTVRFESRCDGELDAHVSEPVNGARAWVIIYSHVVNTYQNGYVLQPGQSYVLPMVAAGSAEVEVQVWGVPFATGRWQQPAGCGPTVPDRLKTGERLVRGRAGDDRITSPDGRFTLVLQDLDGNLVLYEYGRRALWATGPNTGIWLANEGGNGLREHRRDGTETGLLGRAAPGGPVTLVVQNDGNVVEYRDSDHAALWASNTCCHAPAPPQPAAGAHQLNTGQALVLGRRITSPNGVYSLVLQDFDGNLVLYKNGTQALWAFGMRADSWFVNQPDGNLVAYKSEGGVAWASNTYGKGAGTLTLQDDGNLVLYRNIDRAVLWSTNTWGK
ncbi:hypothetical protein [Dactylosporangium sp. NPDC048998]|uniref:hypothetical protein n=1 Tax=Dactylosporangium sp. NPDC048998 TaxID=3363976 RepID=UPI00371EF004